MIPSTDLARISEELNKVSEFLGVMATVEKSNVNTGGDYEITVMITANKKNYLTVITVPFYYQDVDGWLRTLVLHEFLLLDLVDSDKITLDWDTLNHIVSHKKMWRLYYIFPINGKLRHAASIREVDYYENRKIIELRLDTGRKVVMADMEILRRYFIIKRKVSEWREVKING